jgi:hypothetical protein
MTREKVKIDEFNPDIVLKEDVETIRTFLKDIAKKRNSLAKRIDQINSLKQ